MATVDDHNQSGNPALAAEQLRERLGGIIGRLETEANDRVAKRNHIEKRWIEDLQQYHGRYDERVEANLNRGDKSKLFINQTRPKTDAMSARLMDLLFPTDDKNWGIRPTPVPRLTSAAEKAAAEAQRLKDEAQAAQEQIAAQQGQADPNALAQAKQKQEAAEQARIAAEKLQVVLDEARSRSEQMELEIDDQLKESNYHAVKRDQIEDAAKLGTGVTKGPVTGDKVRKGWKRKPLTDGDGNPVTGPNGEPQMGEYALQMSTGNSPAMRHVDIWSFFPSMDARTVEESEGIFERHLMNQKKLRALASLPGFSQDAIRSLLKGKPKQSAPAYLADLRNLTRDNQQISSNLYHVWEYTGPLSVDDMRDLALAMGDDGVMADIDEIDPLTETNAIVWFCDGQPLKFALYPYDSGECIYSVFNLVKDEASIFGYGIPAIMRDPQKSLNAAWRSMMDNAAATSGPQLVISKMHIEPENGRWSWEPRKVWIAKEGLPENRRAFDLFNITSNQNEMANIIALSKQFIDDMTAMPAVAQGEQGSGVTKTAQGMALLMNSANVVFRRIVKNFDDDVTVPDIRRFYDWNMQFSQKDEIKGDYEVDARGSSVLLVREMQAQNLMFIATQLGGHPIYGPMLKNRDVLRKLFQTMMIPANEVVLTDTEIDAIMAQAAAQQESDGALQAQMEFEERKMELEMAKIDADIAKAEMAFEQSIILANMQFETAMIQMAEKMNLSMDQTEAKLQDAREKRQADLAKIMAQIRSKERLAAAEVAVTEAIGPSGGGLF